MFFIAILAMGNANVPFTLNGLQSGDVVSVTISSNAYLSTMSISTDGNYSFSNVPTGDHYIKVEATGYNVPDSKLLRVKNDGSIDPMTGITLVITKMTDDGVWTHSWHEDGSVSGYTTTAYVNKPSTVTFLGKQIVPVDVSSRSILESEHHIVLSDEGATWTQEYAYRLLETMKTVSGIMGTDTAIISLTTNHITDDIQVELVTGGMIATISTDAFAYANPFYVDLDGVRGRFFSKRLHHAIVSMVTNFGNNRNKANSILINRFGCSIYPPNISELTKNTTNEPAENFQEFVPRELVEIINMFEEMPEGFHKIQNLKYLIRRQNGHDHPLYPSAAAVTWLQNDGYIEFMEKAFKSESLFETQRLIIHEKTHMLWEYVFPEEIKNDWITLGGWYEDPNSASGWATTKDTEFVSAYSHAINPNEDMAESVAFYIKNPDMLQSRSLPKYEFIRDRIMHGTRYISRIREDLTFEVLNLFPDYDYPGKIKSVDVIVEGAPDEDKIVTVDITLNHMEGFDDGASKAVLRMWSPKYSDKEGVIKSQYEDLWLFRVNGDAWHLKGSLTISKYSKSGFWTVDDIEITDEQNNQRFEGENDFVWNMYVNNSMEDLESPVYEKGSLRYNLTDVEVDGHQAHNLEVIYKVTDDTGISKVYARLNRSAADSYTHTDVYGTYNPDTHEAHVSFLITEFFPEDDYYVSLISFWDLANTQVMVGFSDSFQDEPRQTIHITTPNPDTEYPELDLSRIFVYAEPTHPEAPDGETKVTINYYVRDNKSGLGKVSYRLRDPQGIDHFEYHYHRNFYNQYFDGDPTVWERYTINVVLPKGSAPGIWGLAELTLEDKVLNRHVYNFVETLIFEPDENQDNYVLFAEMSEYDMLNFNISVLGSTTGYSYVYRVISEESGQEINGTIDADGNTANVRVRSADQGFNVDVSSLPAGKIVIIVQIKDDTGEIVAVRSKTVEKPKLEVTYPVAVADLVYCSENLELVSAGTTTIGEMQYSLDGISYKTTIPTAIDAKDYTIYYRIVDYKGLTLLEGGPFIVTIAAKMLSTPTIMLSETTYIYDGQAKKPTVTVKDGETTIPATEYTVSYSNNTNVGTATVTITDNDGGNYNVSGSSTFSITEAEPIVETTPITIGKSGKASYWCDKNLDFSKTDEIKAFVVTGYDYQGETSTIWLTRVKDVPAGTPIIVKGTAGTTYNIPIKASSSSYYENMLKGNTTGDAITLNPTEGDYMNMVMSGGQFWAFDSPISFPANMLA